MNPHVKSLEDRLAGLFERKAEEFSKYDDQEPAAALVTRQLADLYRDLASIMRR